MRPNPGAPPELSRFAFLIGTWRCDAGLEREDGSWETLHATWVGRYALDGYVILDEFRMTRRTGELVVLGVNLRAYDVEKDAWAMKWLNALGGTWIDLGPEERGGVEIDEQSINLHAQRAHGRARPHARHLLRHLRRPLHLAGREIG